MCLVGFIKLFFSSSNFPMRAICCITIHTQRQLFAEWWAKVGVFAQGGDTLRPKVYHS